MSIETAQDSIFAVAPAWIASGQDLKKLICSTLDSIQNLSPQMSADLLFALLWSLPKVNCSNKYRQLYSDDITDDNI